MRHLWIDNVCVCGCKRKGVGKMTRHSFDDWATEVIAAPICKRCKRRISDIKVLNRRYYALHAQEIKEKRLMRVLI